MKKENEKDLLKKAAPLVDRQEKKRQEIEKLLKKGEELRADRESQAIDKFIDIGLILAKTGNIGSRFFVPTPLPYRVTFPLDFYRQIYRLNNWDQSGKKLHTRPGIIGTWTNWMIYIKYPEGTIKWLREQSPSDGNGNRPYKYFQFLSIIGKAQLTEFIESAIELMTKCSNWDQFKRLLAKGYGKPYQVDMFDKDDVNWKPTN